MCGRNVCVAFAYSNVRLIIIIKKYSLYISKQLRKVIFQFSMETDSFDVDKFVPFKSLKDMEMFISPDDGMLLKKKEALAKRIFAVCDTTSLTNFVSSVSGALFTPQFVRTHKWPTQKYEYLYFN